MKGRWCRGSAGMMTALAIVVMLGLLGRGTADGLDTARSFWPPAKNPHVKLEDAFKISAQKASQDMSKLLLGEKNTRAGIESVFGVYLPSPLPSVVSNKECRRAVLGIIRTLVNPNISEAVYATGRFWPFTMPDSWGKVPDGILYGNTMPWGLQEECTKIVADEHLGYPDVVPPLDLVFRGRYCLISVREAQASEQSSKTKDDGVTLWENLGMHDPRVGVAMTNKGVPFFTYGTCMPSSCTADDLRASIDHVMQPVGRETKNVDCHLEDESIEFTTGDIVFISILAILFTVMIGAAIVDLSINYCDKQELRKGPLKFLLVFSAYSNMKSTFTIRVKEHPDVISCLHGLRVFSMAWVVWGHSYMLFPMVSNNLMHIKQLTNDVLDQIVANASFSVDTFLFLSGLLVTYSLLLEREKNKRVNWILYYIHRFIRLSPPIIFTAAAMATVFRFAMGGPYSANIERIFVEDCRENWWVDALFVGNFVKPSCLIQCWYTAVDTQLYIVAPLVLVPLLTKKRLSLVWLFVVTLVSVAVPMIVVAINNLPPPGVPFVRTDLERKKQVDLYMTPWSRASPYIMGIWTGWLLMQVRGKNIKIHPVAVAAGWMVSTAIALAVLLGMTEYNVFTLKDIHYSSEAINILYGGLSRLAWGVSLMWVVFACHTGYGGIANSILAHPSLQPLSRLTYSLYLVTIPIQIIYSGAIYMPLYMNHLNKVIETCGYLFLGGLVGVPLTLAVERPILGLEKLLLPRPGRSVTEQNQAQEQKKEE